MKKNFLSIAILAVVISMSSCGSSSSFESDARKYAQLGCKGRQLAAKDQSDEKVKKEMSELEKEAEAFRIKMEEKYKKDKDNKEMQEKAEKIMREVMAKCK